MDAENEERRQAEVEFVSSAYAPDEAWCDQEKKVHRRLSLPGTNESDSVSVILILSMPEQYPVKSALHISASVEEDRSTGPLYLTKVAYNAVPHLVESCRKLAAEMVGDEAVFLLMNHADEWIQESWPAFCQNINTTATSSPNKQQPTISQQSNNSKILGRRLIYSHHIISKIKRADMKQLASHYKLTGYIKIGWPGLIIIEGAEANCVNFYEDIKVWAWKYLVVRGEQQEKTPGNCQSIDQLRKFTSFVEESDMSVVANHCRQVGLESLFRTSMKQYDNSATGDNQNIDESQNLYGVLVHVDHMNDGKNYRKWLRKTSSATDVFLLIKQCFPNHDYSKRCTILVAVVGEQDNISDFMKRWRTSRVDVDSKGKACLERQMSVVIEGPIEENVRMHSIGWDDKANAEDSLNMDWEQLGALVESVGGKIWVEALETII